MGALRFTYVGADTNAVLWLQVATNLTGETGIYNATTRFDGWETIETFTFTDTNALSGAKACYLSGLRAPVKGLMRLISDPDVVARALQQEYPRDPSYGAVSITSIMCYDEPPLDARSWTGWNMWTVGWGLDANGPQWSTYSLDGHTVTNAFAYLYDGYDGFSCSLNSSALRSESAMRPLRLSTEELMMGKPHLASMKNTMPKMRTIQKRRPPSGVMRFI